MQEKFTPAGQMCQRQCLPVWGLKQGKREEDRFDAGLKNKATSRLDMSFSVAGSALSVGIKAIQATSKGNEDFSLK
ncbi:hypothetical protein ACFQDN_24745 [Pseudomonas asuensis]|uniref:Uncharacterized protein n=1 Tax=Pseudomonas asuensis TaxID=1825787 RepID=A0ABQ2GZJ2_9PSED|nr:hypothetical protein [Pseudomonas asuensis]GGM19251.1 hypothetical protein GCM10009425_32720 [Pseudomonas asuensis]